VKLQFAIRPTIRNNKDFKRDDVIKTVAAAVGPGHKVDLHGYELLIFVEIYKVQDAARSCKTGVTGVLGRS
jgi:hypothetical protein